MKPVLEILEHRISDTLAKVSGLPNCPAVVRMATDPKFGDYQVNGVMAAAKQLKTNPRQFAEKLVAELKLDDICQAPEIAGPGFINLRLTPEFLANALMNIHRDANLGIEKTQAPQTVVVDYSGPNIAKQMHVGHLRSTIIGDCICRMLESLGHNVIRQNHIGDWGTQFGMLVQYLYQKTAAATNSSDPAAIEKALQNIHIADLEDFYQQAKKLDDEDEAFRSAARQRVVELHTGQNPLTLTLWRQIVNESRKHYLPIYQALHITLKAEDERGESFYADKLESVVKQLQDGSMAVESDGAVCVFPEGFTNKEGAPLPFIIQKSDGAFLYATTDLAAMRFRLKDLRANRIIYVTDARQALHFKMLFAVATMAGWADDSVKLEHVTFGTMLGTDGKPFKTRTGGTVKLAELLDEAIQRARDVVEQKNPELPEEKKAQIAAAVGIGAVKYSDYSNNRDSDYIFSFDKMLAMDGNTAPYMQYAYARIKSIERKAEGKDVNVQAELSSIAQIALTDPAEIDLAKHLIRYGQSIQNAAIECRPNYLTNYLYELSGAFSRFYNACPVLQTEGPIRAARLLLCDLTARTIRHGMSQLLGIDVPEQMQLNIDIFSIIHVGGLMDITRHTLSVSTSSRNQMLNITRQVEQIVSQSGIQDGIVTVFCPHTTAGITINENADPDVCHDILLTLNKLLPQNLPGYQHCEGNSDAHVKSSLVGCSRQVMLSKGSLVLGTWQGLFFCEFDGPRTRSIHVQIMGQ